MIVLGRIVAPFGVQGWVKVQPFGDDPGAWKRMPQWWLSATADAIPETWAPYSQENCRIHGKGLIVQFAGIDGRDAAEAISGHYIAAPREALPQPGKDEYYWGDLVGLKVENESGDTLGTVSGLISTGAHDVLQVQDGELERLIPFVAAYVLDVDLAAGRIQTAWQKDW